MYSDRKHCRTYSEHVNYLLPNIKFLVNLCKNDYEIICSGAVVHRYWVITAATCFTKDYNSNDNITVATYFITRSYIPRNVNEDYKKRQFHIKDAFIHPFFKNDSNSNNIALLKMAEPVTDAYTTSIKLPPRIFILHPAINCTTIGCTINKEIMKTQSNETCTLMEGSVLICFPNVHYMQSILVEGNQSLFVDLGRFREWIEDTVLGIDQFNVIHSFDKWVSIRNKFRNIALLIILKIVTEEKQKKQFLQFAKIGFFVPLQSS
ncbi:uncharacterized protein LOC123301038 [Chrysoperla carnea]|uniref:uncharacterized protein LOC123301038 n=1 Tax=Chrysoperla carnea TaxID=189513 RepID=UPI001D07AB24|nr:uncharacterized protein LOC123301038 [Chrysoperla carnea]